MVKCDICEEFYPIEDMESNTTLGGSTKSDFNFCTHCEAEILEYTSLIQMLYFHWKWCTHRDDVP